MKYLFILRAKDDGHLSFQFEKTFEDMLKRIDELNKLKFSLKRNAFGEDSPISTLYFDCLLKGEYVCIEATGSFTTYTSIKYQSPQEES